jgi:5-methylthioadenosine/S-adenosylhomocysteine deaminase
MVSEQTAPASRRDFLSLGAGLAAAGAAASLTPEPAAAQGADELTRLRAARRILLKGGIVLSMDPRIGDFANADVLIEDGKIREIRPNITAGDAFIIQARDRIVIPGFVDTHSHSYQGLLRSALPSGVVDPDYNRDVQTLLTPHFRPQDVYAGVLVTALALIEMGTTAVVDISQSNHTQEHSDALVKALQDAGIRAVCAFSRGV